MESGVHPVRPPPASIRGLWDRAAPFRVLTALFLLAVLSMMGGIWFLGQQPWLGVRLAADAHGVRVLAVDPAGPSADILAAGDIIREIGGERGAGFAVRGDDLIEDPDEQVSFDAYNRLLDRQQSLHRILKTPVVRLRLEDGRLVRVQPDAATPLRAIPESFWVAQAFAILALLISGAVWSLRRTEPATRLLMISGVGLFLGAGTASIYMGRELAIDGSVFGLLSFFNSFGNRLFAVSGLALMGVYPVRILTARWMMALAAVEFLYLANLARQWVELPPHAFYADYLVLAPLALVTGVRAWMASRRNPVQRAILKALLLPIFLSVLLAMALFVLPVVIHGKPILSVAWSYMLFLIMYAGLAFGVMHVRLFSIERWWVRTWLWFALGLAVVAVDLLVVSLLRWDAEWTLVVSMSLVAWAYFPLRQMVWHRLVHRRARSLEQHLGDLVAHFVRPGSERKDAEFWRSLMEKAFLPVSTEEIGISLRDVILADSGVWMRVPSFRNQSAIELRLPDRGSRLFDEDDLRLARSLYRMACRARQHRRAYRQGMEDERRRIMRDLHDDVGGRLLSLVHTVKEADQRRLAGEALDSLREVIYFSYDGGTTLFLGDLVGRWRAQVHERLDRAGVDMAWEWGDSCEEVQLPARDALNLGRMLYEAVSNALRHARPERIAVRGECREGVLRVEIVNDGLLDRAGMRERDPFGGKGIYNIQQRAEEMGGEASFGREGGEYVVRLSLPVEASDAHGTDSGRS